MRVVIIGLTITSSWGNGHATTYRALVRALARRGHDVLFLEHDKPWYAASRDLPRPPYGATRLYRDLGELQEAYRDAVAEADAVVVGSFVPEGIAIGRWVQGLARGVAAFYDIDTPVTLAALERGDCEYLEPALVPGYGVYLSFTGGPTLARIEQDLGSPRARPLYCSVDPDLYFPEDVPARWDLGYLGTYCATRQPAIERLLLAPARAHPARRFVVAGAQFPDSVIWPANVERIPHLPPGRHRGFYNAQRFTLNVTRADMVAAGWAPSVRLFEASACATPIVSPWWVGLEAPLRPGEEILIAGSTAEAEAIVTGLDESTRRRIGRAARARVLAEHTADHRAAEFEAHIGEARDGVRRMATV